MSLKGDAGTVSGMTIIAELPHNLAVVFRHLEEVGDGHRTLIAFLSLVDSDNAFSLFLFANDDLVRHLLQFALADLVAEFLVAFIDFHADAGGNFQAICPLG